jgi:hypothetical protein
MSCNIVKCLGEEEEKKGEADCKFTASLGTRINKFYKRDK